MKGYQITDRDRGYRRFMRALDAFAKEGAVTVGVHQDTGAKKHEDTGADVIEVATATEFRARSSWLRSTVDAEKGKIRAALVAAARRALKRAMASSAPDAQIERTFQEVADRYRKRLQKKIRDLELVKSGQLLASVEGRVHRGTT